MDKKMLRGFTAGLLAGGVLMAAWPALASTVGGFATTLARYPVYVNGHLYESQEAPVLNVDGRTYVPLRAMSELFGAAVDWVEHPRQVLIAEAGKDGTPQGNTAFRSVTASGSGGKYTVKGEARVFEATMQYAVSDGHDYLLERMYTLDEGAPAWSAFELKVEVPASKLPANGTLTLELFEYSAKDGSRVNIWVVPLETFP